MTDTQAAPPESAPPRRRRRWLRGLLLTLLVALLVIVALLGAGLAWLGSQSALDYVVRRAVEEAQGHLTIDGAAGSLLSAVRVDRIAWQGPDMEVEAREAALAWSPLALLSRHLVVEGLGAKRLSITVKESQSTAAPGGAGLPSSFALPVEVEVKNVGVERLDWKAGGNAGHVSGITFGYSGDGRRHEVHDLRLVTEQGTLTGRAELGASAPFPVAGKFEFEGDGPLRDAKAQLSVDGTLERMDVAADGSMRDAGIEAKATATPFVAPFLVSADIDARNVNLTQFLATLPETALTLSLVARPEGTGFAGSVTARNAEPGPIDANRIPVAALAGKFAWDGKVLTLSDVDAGLAGNARAQGKVALAVDAKQVNLDLKLTNVDLSRLQSSLIATRLSGTLAGEVQEDRQVLRGDIRQEDLALAFSAVVQDRRLTLERARARAGGGTLTGSGTLAFDEPRAFTVTARASNFNPARFVAMPDAKLDGTIDARGTLASPFAVTADVRLAKGSRFAGLAASGTVHARVTPTTARDVAVDVALGSATAVLKGGYGAASDSLAYDVRIPRLAELEPLARRYAADSLPETVAGSLRAQGTVSGDPQDPGVAVDAHGEALAWGKTIRAASLDAKGSIAPGRGPGGPVPLSARAIDLTVSARDLTVPQVSLTSAKLTVSGTLAQHKATLVARDGEIDLMASVSGGLDGTPGTSAAGLAWTGTIESLTNRGTYALSLESPAKLTVAPGHVALGAARIRIAEGRVDIASLSLDEGRITTRGSYTGLPVAAVARLAGQPLPFHSTLVVGGDWSLAATPRINGTLSLHRESGDWYGTESEKPGADNLALGIKAFELTARFNDDAVAATARFESARAGTAEASFTLEASATPGHFDTTAPFTAQVKANLASLKPLQPWLGSVAVLDGRVNLDLSARGTLADPVLAGSLSGDDLRFDLPQYGVHLKDGKLRAHLAEREIILDEFSFAGGAGRFTAHGTLVRAAADGTPAGGKVQWEAKDFTVVNRPDLKLVADGKGTLALEGKKLALTGSISIDEGHVEYEPQRVGTLSDDVVIEGREKQKSAQAEEQPLPLTLDLEVALGRNFRFSGEGLETRLAGRVHVTTTPEGKLAAKGTIRTVGGKFYAFGQRLDIDRGRLLFDGPIDNPGLDVVALRKNLAVEAGVEVSGTVKVPRVRLVSNPPVPDGEKLSWLLTGQGLDRASRNDLALLAAASASLFGQNKKPITTQIANTFGLDDISVRDTGTGTGSGAAGGSGSSGQVVAFGKRLSDRLSLVYEQGLGIANNALRLEYALSRTLTLRAEAGVVSSVGFYYRRSYD